MARGGGGGFWSTLMVLGGGLYCLFITNKNKNNNNNNKAKLHNHSLGFDSVANRPFRVLILQYNHLGFLNW